MATHSPTTRKLTAVATMKIMKKRKIMRIVASTIDGIGTGREVRCRMAEEAIGA